MEHRVASCTDHKSPVDGTGRISVAFWSPFAFALGSDDRLVYPSAYCGSSRRGTTVDLRMAFGFLRMELHSVAVVLAVFYHRIGAEHACHVFYSLVLAF